MLLSQEDNAIFLEDDMKWQALNACPSSLRRTTHERNLGSEEVNFLVSPRNCSTLKSITYNTHDTQKIIQINIVEDV